MELARGSALQQPREVQEEQDEAGMGEEQAQTVRYKRGRIMRLLTRLAPGHSEALGGVEDERGEVHTDPAKMADELRRHWGQVFAARRHDEAKL